MKVKDWLDMIERNTSERFPHLVCGWPDEEHGITHSAYVLAFIEEMEDLDDGADIPQFPTFDNWKKVQRDEDEDRDNLGFSSLRCDLCGSAAGDRHAVTALPDNPAENHDYEALSGCGDCLCLVANADVPDWLEED